MSDFFQMDFSGGSNLLMDATQLEKNESYLIINGRCRYGTVTSIKLPNELSELPKGNFQGIYGAGNFLVVFISGFAYYKDYSDITGNATFKRVEGFSMQVDAPIIYTALVPASTVNFARTSTGSTLSNLQSSSPQCLVCQDGRNQPWLIFPTGVARKSHNYNEWSKTDREYLPIGKMMLYSNGILYIISADLSGRFTQINRSVSGRPIDFMVNINSTGDKLSNEDDGGARSVSYRVDYDEITSISTVSSPIGGVSNVVNNIFITTNRNSYLVSTDYNNTIFGEPTFKNSYLFSTGAINNFSIVDILGDTALIDYVGIRSFNAISAIRVEGKNSPFSAKMSKLFTNIVQSSNAAATFDNYVFFSMITIFGPAIIVYDTIRKNFVGIDIYNNLGLDPITGGSAQIKQFAEIKTNLSRRFFCITTSNKIFELFASEIIANCTVFTKEFISGDPNIELKPTGCFSLFADTKTTGDVTVGLYVDRIFQYQDTTRIDKNLTAISPPTIVVPPFGLYTQDNIDSIDTNFVQVSQGWKFMLSISWNMDSTLTTIKASAKDINMESSLRTQVKAYANFDT